MGKSRWPFSIAMLVYQRLMEKHPTKWVMNSIARRVFGGCEPPKPGFA